jgi:hypothetical protein
VKLSAHAKSELMALDGVVSVGVGLGPDGEPAAVVGVSGATAEIRATLPERIENLPVIVRKIGEIHAR